MAYLQGTTTGAVWMPSTPGGSSWGYKTRSEAETVERNYERKLQEEEEEKREKERKRRLAEEKRAREAEERRREEEREREEKADRERRQRAAKERERIQQQLAQQQREAEERRRYEDERERDRQEALEEERERLEEERERAAAARERPRSFKTPYGQLTIAGDEATYKETPEREAQRQKLSGYQEEITGQLGITSPERAEQLERFRTSYLKKFDPGQKRLEQSIIGSGLAGSKLSGEQLTKYVAETENLANLAIEDITARDEQAKINRLSSINQMLSGQQSLDLNILGLGTSSIQSQLQTELDVNKYYTSLGTDLTKTFSPYTSQAGQLDLGYAQLGQRAYESEFEKQLKTTEAMYKLPKYY